MDEGLSSRAQYHRIALLCGLHTPRDVIAWADQEILAADCPDYALIDISLGSNKSVAEIAALMRSLVRCQNDPAPLQRVFREIAELLRAGRLLPEQAIKPIYDYLRFDRIDHELYLDFVVLEDKWADIRDGVCGNGDMSLLAEPLLKVLDDFTRVDPLAADTA